MPDNIKMRRVNCCPLKVIAGEENKMWKKTFISINLYYACKGIDSVLGMR